jgi:hypothetical protein
VALVEIDRRPAESKLRGFGVALSVGMTLGGVGLYLGNHAALGCLCWVGAAVIGGVWLWLRPLRLPVYLLWMRLTRPLAWLISYLALLVVYFLVLTPIALGLRVFRRDPLARRFDRGRSSYWVKRGTEPGTARYFRQF